MLFSNLNLQGVKTISRHAHKTGSSYLLRVLFKIYNKCLCPFYMGVPLPGLAPGAWIIPVKYTCI